ncbi:MAG: sensor histidine kinase [Acidimicrobiales bacterium]
MARELHDVLAHTLSALSVQLEALDSLVRAGPGTPTEVLEHMDQTKRLVRDGLDEARGAVYALREDASPLADQVLSLAGTRQACVEICGAPRRIAPEASLALYRIAQEALTNVVKHAPGDEAHVCLGFEPARVTLSVSNQLDQASAPAGPGLAGPGLAGSGLAGSGLAGSGGGYGIAGMKERLLLLGGRVEAGPSPRGWRVEAEVPA